MPYKITVAEEVPELVEDGKVVRYPAWHTTYEQVFTGIDLARVIAAANGWPTPRTHKARAAVVRKSRGKPGPFVGDDPAPPALGRRSGELGTASNLDGDDKGV